METFSERLQKLLKEKKIKQTHLQYIIGIKQATISTWVLGKAMPQRATMENLAKALGVTAQYLEYGDEPNTFKVEEPMAEYGISREELLEFYEWKKQKTEAQIQNLKSKPE